MTSLSEAGLYTVLLVPGLGLLTTFKRKNDFQLQLLLKSPNIF